MSALAVVIVVLVIVGLLGLVAFAVSHIAGEWHDNLDDGII